MDDDSDSIDAFRYTLVSIIITFFSKIQLIFVTDCKNKTKKNEIEKLQLELIENFPAIVDELLENKCIRKTPHKDDSKIFELIVKFLLSDVYTVERSVLKCKYIRYTPQPKSRENRVIENF